MEIGTALDFLRSHHRGVLATARADGGPQLSPVVAAVDAEGKVVISTRETAVKTHNVRRRPYAWLLAMSDGFFGEWVQVEGSVDVLSLPAALDGLVDYYRRVSGEHPDWEEYRAAMRSERRVLLRLAVQRAGPDRSG
jgi:PPOX class probable F420-dependent enzyme